MKVINYNSIKPVDINFDRLLPILIKYSGIDKGSTIIEGGTHSGYCTARFAGIVGMEGKVVSFEPNYYFIRYVMNKWKFRDNIEIYPFALSDKLELVDVGHSFLLPTGDNLLNDALKSSKKSDVFIKNIGIPLDLIEKQLNIEKLDYMYLNVEGYGCKILKGAINTIKKFKPRILMQPHIFNDGTSTADEFDNILKPLGYEIIVMPEKTNYKFAIHKDKLNEKDSLYTR